MWTLFSCFPQQRTMNSTPPTAEDLMLPGMTNAWCSIGIASHVSVCCFTNLGQFVPCPRLLSLFDLLFDFVLPLLLLCIANFKNLPFSRRFIDFHSPGQFCSNSLCSRL